MMHQSTVADLEHPILLTILAGLQKGGAIISIWARGKREGYLAELIEFNAFGEDCYLLTSRHTWVPFDRNDEAQLNNPRTSMMMTDAEVEAIVIKKIDDVNYQLHIFGVDPIRSFKF